MSWHQSCQPGHFSGTANQELFFQPLCTPLHGDASCQCPQFLAWVLFTLLCDVGFLADRIPLGCFVHTYIDRPSDRQAIYINISLHTDFTHKHIYTHTHIYMHIYAQTYLSAYIFPLQKFLIYFSFVCYMHVCVCVWLPPFLWAHTKAIGPISTTSFLRQGLSFRLKLTNLARLVAQQTSGTCLSVTLLVLQTVCLDTWFVFGCWGSKLKSCCLCDLLSHLEFLVRLCFLR